jgi:hypothetical protein
MWAGTHISSVEQRTHLIDHCLQPALLRLSVFNPDAPTRWAYQQIPVRGPLPLELFD